MHNRIITGLRRTVVDKNATPTLTRTLMLTITLTLTLTNPGPNPKVSNIILLGLGG